MNKKKVKELSLDVLTNIKEAISRTDDVLLSLTLANIASKIALIGVEVNKSDWVSVEDELPPCEEEVLVRDINAKGNWSKPWICYRSKNECYRHITDNHKFVTTRLGEITHWKPIEKLEE